MFKKIRLVWNLTLRCRYRCSHCAASAVIGNSEDYETKFRILRSIVDSGLPVDIDFAGGDPWCGIGGLELMQSASAIYGSKHISISSVGASVLEQDPKTLQGLAASYDFTYDRPWWYKDDVRQDYNLANFRAMQMLDNLGIEHGVALPVWQMDEQYQYDLMNSLLSVHPCSIRLLRLMPVGRNRQIIVNDHAVADQLIRYSRALSYRGLIKKNCAMTGQCNGLSDHKLGLDHHGNLYWCIWAADLPVRALLNPFYLGNVLEEPLFDILSRHSDKAEHLSRNVCHVLSYIQSLGSTNPRNRPSSKKRIYSSSSTKEVYPK